MTDKSPFTKSTAVLWASTEAFITSSTPSIVKVTEATTAAWMTAARLGPPPPRLLQCRLPLRHHLLLHHRLPLPQNVLGLRDILQAGDPASPRLDRIRLLGNLQHYQPLCMGVPCYVAL